ncbi:MAG TPA: PAS domain S-box protein [Burkholderiales bacterium]
MQPGDDTEEELLRSVALQNANAILHARQRAEQELIAAKEALRDTSERLQATFNQAAVGMAIAELDGRFVELNDKFSEILGYPREELNRMTFLELTHPEDLPQTQANVRRLVSGEIPHYVHEKRYVRKNGSLVWSLTTVALLKDAPAQRQRFIGVIEDITDRKRAEEALRESDQFNRSIIQSSRDCIKTLSLDGVLLWMSETGRELFCIGDAEQVIGKSWIDFWQGEERAAATAAVKNAALGGSGNFVGSFAVNGQPMWWNVLVTPIFGAAGRPDKLLVVSRDITARKQAEERVHEERRILELLNKTGTTLAANLDLQTLVQAVTDAATELSGARVGSFFYNTTDETGDAFMLYTLSGAPREAFEKFGQPRATELFAHTFRGEGPLRCDDVLKDARYGKMAPHYGMPKGHLPVRSYLAVPVASRSGDVIGGLFFGHPEPGVFTERHERIIVGIAAQAAIAIDNARLFEAAQKAAEERKQLLDSERAARAEAERASAMKDEFLATLSHELRTPLSAILGWSQVLRRGVRSERDLQQGLETIERNARIQTQLIEDLLDMSRITSGKLRLDIQPVEPVPFIEAAIETVRPSADAKGVRLEKMLDAAAGPISGDASRLQQVVWNLLSNAIKFTPKGGTVQVLLERVNSHVEISVADTGIGIAPEFVPHVFERFRQADASMTRSFGGLGLGLAIVKHLVELHGGTVNVKSPGEGLGTTFSVHLPVAVVHRSIDKGERLHPRAPKPLSMDFEYADLSGIKVLVVDDEADARGLIERVLTECNAHVTTAISADEALTLMERETPDVLVSDIGMPGVDGYEFLRRVRSMSHATAGRLPAIALTAFARSEDRTRALRAGFLVHVSKPVEPSELVATVASVAGRTGHPPQQ